MFGLMWPIERSRSAGIRFSTFSAIGVKRRMRRSPLTITMAIWTLPSRLIRSLLTRLSSSLRDVQLLVDGVQLLVGRLQLLLGGVELLVGALQLLVARQDLLVGRLQLLVGGFELLDDRLQVLAAGGQLALQQLRDAAGRLATAGGAGSRSVGAARPRARPSRRWPSNSTRKCSRPAVVSGITSSVTGCQPRPPTAPAGRLAHAPPRLLRAACERACAARRAALRAPSSAG